MKFDYRQLPHLRNPIAVLASRKLCAADIRVPFLPIGFFVGRRCVFAAFLEKRAVRLTTAFVLYDRRIRLRRLTVAQTERLPSKRMRIEAAFEGYSYEKDELSATPATLRRLTVEILR